MTNHIPQRGVVRTCEPFKFWWAPTVYLERLNLGGQILNTCGLCQVSAYGWQITLKVGVVRVTWPIFTARRYAGAIYAVVLRRSVRSSVRPSVCHKPVLYQNIAKCRIMQTTPYDDATPNWDESHPIAAHYSSIDPVGMKGWVGLVSWPIADGLPA